MSTHTRTMETWERRYYVPSVFGAQIAAHQPDRGVVSTNPAGVFQAHAWDVTAGEIRPVTNVPHGVLFSWISPDGRYIYYHSDTSGNELGHWVRVPFEGGHVESLTPNMPPYHPVGIGPAGDARRVGIGIGTPEGTAVLAVDVSEDGALAPPRELLQLRGLAHGPILSGDGALASVMSTERSGGVQFSLLAIDMLSGRRVAELWDGEGTSIQHAMFAPHAGDDRVLATSNRSGVKRPLIWNPRTGERVDVTLDHLQGEIVPLDWSSDGRTLLLGQTDRAVQRLHRLDLETGEAVALDHPGGSFGFLGMMNAFFGRSGEIIAQWQDATHPLQLVELDTSGRLSRSLLPTGDVPDSRPWRSISFHTPDEQEIQGWLCVPAHAGPYPTVLHTHGGPSAATMETFDAGCQALVDSGFAVCTINYRGSTTFGRDFEEAIWGDLGNLEVVDMVAAREWLIASGVAIPDQIVLAGRSYGGYLTLQAMGLHPDLWAGGMAGVPVVDWPMSYEDESDVLRNYTTALLGGTPEEKPEQYARSSPLTYVDRVRAPVLILYGVNDTRCPARPIEEYIRRLEARSHPVEVYRFETGHLGAMADREEGVKEERVMLDFALRAIESKQMAAAKPPA